MNKSFVTSPQRFSGSLTSQISLFSLLFLFISLLLSFALSLSTLKVFHPHYPVNILSLAVPNLLLQKDPWLLFGGFLQPSCYLLVPSFSRSNHDSLCWSPQCNFQSLFTNFLIIKLLFEANTIIHHDNVMAPLNNCKISQPKLFFGNST